MKLKLQFGAMIARRNCNIYAQEVDAVVDTTFTRLCERNTPEACFHTIEVGEWVACTAAHLAISSTTTKCMWMHQCRSCQASTCSAHECTVNYLTCLLKVNLTTIRKVLVLQSLISQILSITKYHRSYYWGRNIESSRDNINYDFLLILGEYLQRKLNQKLPCGCRGEGSLVYSWETTCMQFSWMDMARSHLARAW